MTNHIDSFHFIMVNSTKNILNKKNHLTCDSTTEEVLTTTILPLIKSKYTELNL